MSTETPPPDAPSSGPLAEAEHAAREMFGAVWDASRGGLVRARDAFVSAIETLLDRVANSVVHDPLAVRDAREARHRIDEFSANLGGAAAAIGGPWLINKLLRFARRGRIMPSAAVVAAATTTLTAATAGTQHLRVLASLLVQRLREGGHRVDPAFVRRVAVAIYLDPSAGVDAVRPNRMAAARLASDWGTHALPLVGRRKSLARVYRAAEAIERLDLDAAIDRYERDRAIDLTATTRSD
jgi:hypothetical protein